MILHKKGYNLIIRSWENDGDHYETNSKYFRNKEDAIKIAKMFSEFIDDRSNDDSSYDEDIIEYLEENKDIEQIILNTSNSITDDEEKIDLFFDYVNEILGSSEWYTFRVPEEIKITYSPKKIEVEEIKF